MDNLELKLESEQEKINIGIDLDNVVIDSMHSLLHSGLLDRLFPNKLTRRLAKKYFTGKFLTSLSSNEDSRKGKIIQKVMGWKFGKKAEEILLSLGPIPHAKEAIDKIHSKYNAYFITARNSYYPNIKAITFKWFDKNKIKYEKDKFYFCEEKADLAKKLGIKIFIEDHKGYALKLAKEGVEVYLFDYDWNKEINSNEKKIHRIKNNPSYWLEIEKLLLGEKTKNAQ